MFVSHYKAATLATGTPLGWEDRRKVAAPSALALIARFT